MVTLIIILCVVIIYFSFRHTQHQQEIIDNNRQYFLDKHEKAVKKHKILSIASGIALLVGTIIALTCELSYEETVSYWFFGDRTGTRTVTTTAGWWAYTFIGVGGLVGIISVIKYCSNKNKYQEFEFMTDVEFQALQQKTILQKHQEEEQERKQSQARMTKFAAKTIVKMLQG